MKTGVIFIATTLIQGLLVNSDPCNINIVVGDDPVNITSPNYPQPYPSNADCQWNVTAANSTKKVIFHIVDTDIASPCNQNSLDIYYTSNLGSNGHMKICGNATGNTYISQNNSILITFKSDEFTRNKRGFLIQAYQAPGCKSHLKALSTPKYLPAPGYPLSYANHSHCVWTIETENENDTILIEMSDMDLREDCIFDTVSFYYGSNNQFQKKDTLGRFCGTDKPILQSPGNQLMIVFKTLPRHHVQKGAGFSLTYKSLPATDCSRSLVAGQSKVIIVPPGYPDAIPSDLECVWTIKTLTPSLVPQLQFMSADMEDEENCTDSSVTVLQETLNTGMDTFCGNSTPTYTSESDVITVIFRTGHESASGGFKMYYQFTQAPKPIIHTSLTASLSNQYLSSPGYPFNYENNVDMSWTITASTDTMFVRIFVMDSEIERCDSCDCDYVKVFDGPDIHSSMLGKWCRDLTPIYQSTGRSLTLLFHTDGSNAYKGFRLMYTQTRSSHVCGGFLTAPAVGRHLRSPAFTSSASYNDSLDCTWIIMTREDHIRAEVVYSEMNSTTNCSSDYVKIYDGQDQHATAIGKFCGNSTPAFNSTGQYLTITFHADKVTIDDRGFELRYYGVPAPISPTVSPTVGSKCGSSSISAGYSHKHFTSPGYPIAYDRFNNGSVTCSSCYECIESEQRVELAYQLTYRNLDCTWTFTALTERMVRINVIEFEIETSPGCLHDYVAVYDGPTVLSNRLGVWCGNTAHSYQSTGLSITLHFHTNGAHNFKGFKLEYYGTDDDNTCGGPLTATKYPLTIYSPGYRYGHYDNYLNCIWKIQTSLTNVKIEFRTSDIESTNDCSYDYVKVYDGQDTSSPLLGKFCGTTAPTYVSTSGFVTINFVTDASNTGRGFKLRYTGGDFTPSVTCGQLDLVANMFSSSSYISSPNYPQNYPNNADCSWRIDTQDSNQVVSIDVLTSYIESSVDCSYDYVEAFDGYDETATSLGRWCGLSIPDKQSSGRYMYIKFKTDSSNTDSGFQLAYSSTSKDTSTTDVGAIVGGVIGSIVFLAIVISVVWAAKRSSRSPYVTRVQDSSAHGLVHTVQYGNTASAATSQAPPPY